MTVPRAPASCAPSPPRRRDRARWRPTGRIPSLGGTALGPGPGRRLRWRSGQVPPVWAASAIDAAAADAGATRASRAAQFVRCIERAPASSPTASRPAARRPGIACFDRAGAPSSFKMWFRAHGYVFDWGTLRWCQGLADDRQRLLRCREHRPRRVRARRDPRPPREQRGRQRLPRRGGPDRSAGPARRRAGTPTRSGAATSARLQLEYDRTARAALFSTCLDRRHDHDPRRQRHRDRGRRLGPVHGAPSGRRTSTANRALANDPISGRTVLLQRRSRGTPRLDDDRDDGPELPTRTGPTRLTVSPTATYEWRGDVRDADERGPVGSSSAAVKVTVSGGCAGSGCPSRGRPGCREPRGGRAIGSSVRSRARRRWRRGRLARRPGCGPGASPGAAAASDAVPASRRPRRPHPGRPPERRPESRAVARRAGVAPTRRRARHLDARRPRQRQPVAPVARASARVDVRRERPRHDRAGRRIADRLVVRATSPTRATSPGGRARPARRSRGRRPAARLRPARAASGRPLGPGRPALPGRRPRRRHDLLERA